MKFISYAIETYPWVLVFVLPVLGFMFMLKVRVISLRLSKQRMKRLYDLAASDRWRGAHPIALQIAVSDALRCTLDGRVIGMAFSRHNSMRMLIDSKYALGVAKVNPSGNGFLDDRKFTWPSLKRTARILHFVSISPWLVAAVAMYTPWASAGFLLGAAIVGAIYTPVFTWLALSVEAARRLVEELDERYPLIQGGDTVSTKVGKKSASKADSVSAIRVV